MWSAFYDYYEIRSSEAYAVYAETAAVQAILSSHPELMKIGEMAYINAVGYPWLQLNLDEGNSYGFGRRGNEWHSSFNIIPIVCSKSEAGLVPASQLDFLCRLAQQLRWELVQEENDK